MGGGGASVLRPTTSGRSGVARVHVAVCNVGEVSSAPHGHQPADTPVITETGAVIRQIDVRIRLPFLFLRCYSRGLMSYSLFYETIALISYRVLYQRN